MEKQLKSYGRITISTTINGKLWAEAKRNGIQWSEALRRGIVAILSERGHDEYINPLNQQRKIVDLVGKLEEFSQKIYKYEEELKKLRGQK